MANQKEKKIATSVKFVESLKSRMDNRCKELNLSVTDYIVNTVTNELETNFLSKSSNVIDGFRYTLMYENNLCDESIKIEPVEVNYPEKLKFLTNIPLNNYYAKYLLKDSKEHDQLIKKFKLHKLPDLIDENNENQYFLDYLIQIFEKEEDNPDEILVTEQIRIVNENDKPEFILHKCKWINKENINLQMIQSEYPYVKGVAVETFLFLRKTKKVDIESLNSLPINNL